jgi:hypothetical protein
MNFDDELEPVTKAPTLFTINTFGFKLYGKSDYDPETDSFMTTHYFVALLLPLIPIARYRVISEDGYSYRFLGKGKFRRFEMIHLAVIAGIAIYLFATRGLD